MMMLHYPVNVETSKGPYSASCCQGAIFVLPQHQQDGLGWKITQHVQTAVARVILQRMRTGEDVYCVGSMNAISINLVGADPRLRYKHFWPRPESPNIPEKACAVANFVVNPNSGHSSWTLINPGEWPLRIFPI